MLFRSDLPTVAEAGLPGYELVTWFGFLVPAATPGAVVRRLHEDTLKAMASPEVQKKLAVQSVEVIGEGPDKLAAFLRAEVARYAKLVKSAGMRAE